MSKAASPSACTMPTSSWTVMRGPSSQLPFWSLLQEGTRTPGTLPAKASPRLHTHLATLEIIVQ